MFLPIVGLVLIGGAAVLSRGSQKGLGGLGAPGAGPNTDEAMDAVQRAATGLYPPVNRPRDSRADNLWDDADYKPVCQHFDRESLEALYAAKMAEDADEPEAFSAKAAAIQAWALAQVECGQETPEKWALEEAEKPLRRV